MNKLQNKLDVMIISASRPKLVPYVMESFDEHIWYHGKIRYMLHEDYVYPKESEKVKEICKNNNYHFFNHNPAKGIGNAIEFMLNKVETDYVFNMQDDFEFDGIPIDVNHILWVMDKNPHINGVFFNKRKNMKVINGYNFNEEEYNGLRLCLSNQWPLFNGIWRTSFMKKHWNTNCGGKTQEAYWNHTIKKGRSNDHKFLRENIGGYYYGPLLYPRTIRHLGYTWAVKPKGSYAKKKDGYGGNAAHDLSGQPAKQRAPWLPPEEERPLYLENKKDQIKAFNNENNR